jgi:predicted acetyltransferase
MLAAALPLAGALRIDPARVDCEAGNAASGRVSERSGGVLDEERDGNLYFWVPTA